MNYKENFTDANKYRQKYLNELNLYIAKQENGSDKIREDYAKNILKNPEFYRDEFKKMLGRPLSDTEKRVVPQAEPKLLSKENNFFIYRVSIEILDGLSMTGLLFKIDNNKRPLVIAQHGGSGTPELISGILGGSANYNDMTERILKYGANVFAPQLLLWDANVYSINYDRINMDAKLKRVGSSLTAVEVYGITRILDYFENENYVGNFGMIGLSYGGFYTLFASAADTRIKSAISCSWFNKRAEYSWSDWTWFGASGKFNDAEIACLVYPRKLCIEIGNSDELFDSKFAKEETKRLVSMCSKVGTDWLNIIYFDGTHEFHKDDAPIIKLINELK